MDRRLRRFGIVAAVALAAGTSGCGLLPSRDDSARLHQQAQAALTRWTDAVAAVGGQSAFIPVGELTGQVGDWEEAVGDNNKPALMAGLFEAVVTLPTETPPDGDLRRQDGSIATVPLISAQKALSDLKADAAGSACPECVPLQITAVRLTTGPVDTSRGPAVAPVWEFTVQGTAVRVTRVAIADRVTVVPPPWDSSDPPAGISIESATGTVAGRQLAVAFTGAPDTGDKPCGADYTAEAVESPTAVVVIVTEHRHGFGEACTLVGARRTAEAELSAPLGERAVLEVREGRPVAVLLTR
jgi:hypothetical protein